MKIVFEKDEVNDKKLFELIRQSIMFYEFAIKSIDEGAELTNINMYISGKTSDGNLICGLNTLGNTWIVKPENFVPLTPSGKISTSKKYKNEYPIVCKDEECVAKIYYSTDPKQM